MFETAAPPPPADASTVKTTARETAVMGGVLACGSLAIEWVSGCTRPMCADDNGIDCFEGECVSVGPFVGDRHDPSFIAFVAPSILVMLWLFATWKSRRMASRSCDFVVMMVGMFACALDVVMLNGLRHTSDSFDGLFGALVPQYVRFEPGFFLSLAAAISTIVGGLVGMLSNNTPQVDLPSALRPSSTRGIEMRLVAPAGSTREYSGL